MKLTDKQHKWVWAGLLLIGCSWFIMEAIFGY